MDQGVFMCEVDKRQKACRFMDEMSFMKAVRILDKSGCELYMQGAKKKEEEEISDY